MLSRQALSRIDCLQVKLLCVYFMIKCWLLYPRFSHYTESMQQSLVICACARVPRVSGLAAIYAGNLQRSVYKLSVHGMNSSSDNLSACAIFHDLRPKVNHPLGEGGGPFHQVHDVDPANMWNWIGIGRILGKFWRLEISTISGSTVNIICAPASQDGHSSPACMTKWLESWVRRHDAAESRAKSEYHTKL